METNKALERLDSIEKEAAELRKIIENANKPKNIMDRVKTFSDACEVLGINPNQITNNTLDSKDEIAYKKLKIITKALKDEANTTYCLKIDVKKFYPSIDNNILKSLLRRKIKDNNLLWLIYEIIDSHIGLPLGNYPSQNLANFYLSPFDHWLKEECRVKYVYRYCDDIVILSSSKEYLHDLLIKIKDYLSKNLNLTVKSNYQVFPVSARMIDFVGYPVNHRNVKLRPRIKKKMMRMLNKNRNPKSEAAYKGWLKHCNSKHLQKKIANAN